MSSYDQKLLDATPAATRAQLQEGYNVDLLEPPPPRRAPSVRAQPPQSGPVTVPLTPALAESEEKFTAPERTSTNPAPKPSFWRSRNGVIAVILIVLIVIGAVVGGAVGGTVKSSNNDHTTGIASNSSNSSPNLSSSSSSTHPPASASVSGGGNNAPGSTESAVPSMNVESIGREVADNRKRGREM